MCEQVQSYGYMTVTLLSRENRVAYIKREFTVYNKKVSVNSEGMGRGGVNYEAKCKKGNKHFVSQ